MWFGVLGPLLVRDGERVVSVPGGRQRVLLAALLLRAGAVVPVQALAEVVWDGAPPDGAEITLRSHVFRLRRALGPAAEAVVTRYPGYLVEVSEGEVDLLRFRSLVREGGAAARESAWARAWEVLTEGLGLWRGEPLEDVPSVLLRREQVPGLERLRLQAVDWRVEAGLQLGRHGELVGELQSLVAREPLQERFHGQLMLALVRCGRQAEALEAYQSAREALVEELGTEPGAELRELHQRILTADPALAVSAYAAAGARRAAVVPRELPAPVAGFVGRVAELAALTGLLDRSAEGTSAAVVISAIGGTAGVGKTALAVQWAHQLANRFPDGQLFVNLRGYDLDQPMPSADALAGFLRALGVPGQDIPPEGDERAARYRSLLAGRRMLVVLDNAWSVEQVRPLLPGSPSCAVLVTSRDSLAGLVARDGATRLELDLLPPAEAVLLLRELIGARARDDPGAAETLAVQCCRLPLALRVAAELAVARPDVPLAELAGELSDQQRRLDLLQAGGDLRTAVRAAFSWSLRHLDANAARAFRLLGLHPSPDFEAYAVGALIGTGLQEARRVRDELARAHLIQSARPGRHGIHDLLRAYAAELAARDGEGDRRAALTRLFDYYLHTAATAMDTMFPAERHRRPRIAPSAAPAPPATDPARAQTWLDEERATLVAVAAYTADHGWPGHATQLAVTLSRYLDSGGHYPEAITIHTCAQYAARRAGDRAAEANALTSLGTLDARMGHCRQATDHHQQALALFREMGDQQGEARALHNLGTVGLLQARPQQAGGYFQEALRRYRQVGDRTGEARTLNNLGTVDGLQGRYQQATEHHQQALALCKEIGDRVSEAHALTNLGSAYQKMGRYHLASDYQRQALALARETNDRTCQAHALVNLGHISVQQGRYQLATDHHQQALDLLRKMGNQSGEAEALNGLGDIALATSRPGDARTQHATALNLASQAGDRAQQARAHDGLARAHFATGDPGRARHHWQEALTRYTELDAPEADQVRAQLAAAGERVSLQVRKRDTDSN